MTLKRRAAATNPISWKPNPPPGYVQFPDAPRKEEMTSPKYLLYPGKARALGHWLGNFETTLITFDLFLSPAPFAELREMEGRRDVFYPDMMIAFDVDPQVVANRNGYAISDHGKPPDLIMEVASGSTFRNDATRKREGYAALGVREYWRFNSGVGPRDFPRLSGDRLVGGRYEPLPIEEWAPGHYRGYSEALRLYVCWEEAPVSEQTRDARLEWYDPIEGVYLPGYDAVMEARDAADAARLAAEARAHQAEARIRQLEAENHRLRNQ